MTFSEVQRNIHSKMKEAGVNGVTPIMHDQILSELSLSFNVINDRAQLQGGDVLLNQQAQTAYTAKMDSYLKSQSLSERSKEIAGKKKTDAENKFWELSPTRAFLAQSGGEQVRNTLLTMSNEELANYIMTINPALAREFGITNVARGFQSTVYGIKDAKGENVTATAILARSDEMINLMDGASKSLNTSAAGQLGGPPTPKKDKEGLLAVASASGAEGYKLLTEAEDVQDKGYTISAINDNPIVSAQITVNAKQAIADAAPGAVSIGVSTLNTLTQPTSRMMQDFNSLLGKDVEIGFELGQDPNASLAYAKSDTAKLVIKGVPKKLQSSTEFIELSNTMTGVWEALKLNPSLWAGNVAFERASDAFEAMVNDGYQLDYTVAQETAKKIKAGSREVQVNNAAVNPTITREIPTTGDAKGTDVPLAEGATVDKGKVDKNTTDKGTRLNPDGTPAMDQALNQKDFDSLQDNFLELIDEGTTEDEEQKLFDIITQVQELRARNRVRGEPARFDPNKIKEFIKQRKVPASMGKPDEAPFPTTGAELDVDELRESLDGKAPSSVLDKIANVETSHGAKSDKAYSQGKNASGYEGKYQFRYRDKKDAGYAIAVKLGIDPKAPKTPEQQEAIMADYVKTNTKALKAKGHPVTPYTLWLAHNQGAGGANAILTGRLTKGIRRGMINQRIGGEESDTDAELIAKYHKKFRPKFED
ncbi:MAG: hypothetical protein DRP42_06445 [Tenericutes bacterium]|nr:MAG: hypothetical protein DRP42_06445 [Mycoplasmatota bacterium]